jgi:hypothetical protein
VGCMNFDGTLAYFEEVFFGVGSLPGGAGGAGGAGLGGTLPWGGRGGVVGPTSDHTPAPSSCSLPCVSGAGGAGAGGAGAGGSTPTANLLRCTVGHAPCLVADVASSNREGTCCTHNNQSNGGGISGLVSAAATQCAIRVKTPSPANAAAAGTVPCPAAT